MLPPPDVDPVVRPATGVLWMVIGRRDSAGDLDARIALSVDFGRLFAPEVGPMSQWTRESITVAGVPGEIVRDGVNGLTIVEYQLGEQVIALESRDAADPAVLDAMLEIAGLLTVDEGTAELAGAMPDGFEVLAEAKEPPSDIATTLWYSDGTNVRAGEPARPAAI